MYDNKCLRMSFHAFFSGYAEFKTWGAWSTCSKQCGGGKRSRSRECASTDEIPCTDDTTEEVDCNTQSCPQNGM